MPPNRVIDVVVSEKIPTPEDGRCIAYIKEEVTDRVLWEGGPYPDAKSAMWAAGRQFKRLAKRLFPEKQRQ